MAVPGGASPDDDIARLLANEQRLSQILTDSQPRSMNLIGKSNPRYQWDKYWKREEELHAMPAPLYVQYYVVREHNS
jgi:hypothetical protein